jgi:pyrroloquinoline quinone biosynthesis protein D
MGKSAQTREVPPVTLASVPRVHVEATLSKVGGQWMAATADAGLHTTLHTFEGPEGVSEVGERIVELIDGKRSVAGMVEVLLQEFEVSREVAEADTLEFITELFRKKVLELA